MLKDAIGQIQKALETFDETPLGKRYEFETMMDCIARIRAHINYIRETWNLEIQ